MQAHLQREKLLALEIVRLRAFFAVGSYRDLRRERRQLRTTLKEASSIEGRLASIESDLNNEFVRRVISVGSVIPESSVSVKSVATSLYIELCSILDQEGLLVRPTCMGFFWKYLLASSFDQNLGLRNLKHSHAELHRDGQAIPPWSVYQFLVPRCLASESLLTTRNSLETFEPEAVGALTVARFKSEIRNDIIDIILNAQEALSIGKDRVAETGDLHLGLGQDEDVIDGAIIVYASILYKKYFKESILSGTNYLRGALGAALDVLDTSSAKGVELPSVLGESLEQISLQAIRSELKGESVYGS